MEKNPLPDKMEFESRLVPILRDGINIIKMVFYIRLKEHLRDRDPEADSDFLNRLSGAVLNELFGTPNPAETFAAFARENRAGIDAVLGRIAEDFPELRLALTDALRMQALCDHQEGMDSTSTLTRARDLDILLVDREMPLPPGFLHLARKLGRAFGLVTPPPPANRT